MRVAELTALLAGLSAPETPEAAANPTPVTIAALPASETGNRGAALPFLEYEAENASGNGEPIGPGRSFTSLASEASGRRAILLKGRGRYVEFTLAAPANAVSVRYAIPDGADGKGMDATLGIYAGQARIGSLHATSRYGWFYGAYPFSNRPADGKPHHFYDEARLLLGRTLPAGSKVRLMVGEEDRAPWYAVDLADFELVPGPLAPPPGHVSITAFGADPSGRKESSGAIRAAIAASRKCGLPVWIPPGTFRLDRHIIVDRVTLRGAGPWHSVIRGNGAGLYGRKAPRGSRAVVLQDFALIGEVTERVDKAKLAGIGGAMGGGSRISNLWIQHHKVGLWFDGPMDGIVISDLRIVDNSADGLNFRRGVSNAIVENSLIRNSGDDGLAMWSHRQADHHNIFRNNTIVAPILANGIAVYGGHDITISGNLVADSVTQGGGIHVGNRFDAVPVSGKIRISDNLIVRSGSFDPNWRFGVGALWFYALDAPMTARIEVRNTDIVDSTLEAVQFIGKPISAVQFDQVTIRNASHAFQLRSPGSATFSRVISTGLRNGGILDCSSGFAIIEDKGNSGWQSRTSAGCGPAE